MRTFAAMIGLSMTLALGACAAVDWDSFRTPDASIFTPRSVSNFKTPELKPVTAEDLVDAEGRCASAFATPEIGPDGNPIPTTAVPLVPAGIGLEMTECDVVRRAGHPERVQVGTNDRNERTLIMTVINGERPGIYNFTSGRLVSMERAPEPPTPPKPVRKAKPKAKPKAKTST